MVKACRYALLDAIYPACPRDVHGLKGTRCADCPAAWRLVLDETRPVAVLVGVAGVAREFPGDDALVLVIGERRLVVPVRDCPALREAVERVIT